MSAYKTYQSGESNGGLDGVETDVKDQTEQILGIKSGGSTSSASAADGTATVGEAEATSDSATSGQQGGETYSAGIKSGLDALLGSA